MQITPQKKERKEDSLSNKSIRMVNKVIKIPPNYYPLKYSRFPLIIQTFFVTLRIFVRWRAQLRKRNNKVTIKCKKNYCWQTRLLPKVP